MGSVIRRFVVLAALLALAAPAGARASTVTTYGLPWTLGPQGGDAFNMMERNPDTGEMLVLRATPGTPGGALGCDGEAGYSNFAYDFTAAGSVEKISVSFREAIVNPYTWLSLSLRQGDRYVDTTKVRGLVLGDSVIELEPDESVSGALTLWFGIETAQSCGNFDGGRAIFDTIFVTTA